MKISKVGIDANGRSFYYVGIKEDDGSIVRENKYSIIGVPPEYYHERFIWNNASATRSSKKSISIPLERVWIDLLKGNTSSGDWKYADGSTDKCASGEAVAEAIQQNLGCDNLESLCLGIPNYLDESGQEMLLRGLRGVGFSDAKLLWRPIALALCWLSDHGNELKRTQGELPKVWVIDFESCELEVTCLDLRERKGHIVPLRKCPQERGHEEKSGIWPSYSYVLDFIIKSTGIELSHAHDLMWGGFGGKFQEGLENNEFSQTFWLRDGLQWRPVEIKEPDAGDFWNSELDLDKEMKSNKKTLKDHLVKKLPKERINEGDIILWHGWPVRIFSSDEKGEYESTHQYVLSSDSVAKGCSCFLDRLERSLPTYLDTLPQHGIWVEDRPFGHEPSWGFYPLIDKDIEVEGGEEYGLDAPIDSLLIKQGSSTFPLILRRGGGDDCRSSETMLPETTTEDIKVFLDASMRPASGFALVTLRRQDGQWFSRAHRSIKLNWDAMERVPRPEPPPIVGSFGYPFVGAFKGRILLDSGEYYKLKNFIDAKTLSSSGMQVEHINYLNKEENNIFLPWGWERGAWDSVNIGMFGPCKTKDEKVLDMATNLGELLFDSFNNNNIDRSIVCKLMGYMYIYTPEAFVNYLFEAFSEDCVKFPNQIIAVGRVFSKLREFEVFVDYFIKQKPYPKKYTQWFFWSFMRCLCYYAEPARLPAGKARQVFQILINYFKDNMNRGGSNSIKFALSAVVFGLRVRELNRDFLGENDSLRNELVEIISNLKPQCKGFPSTMFKGSGLKPKEGDNLNNYVLRFLKNEETAEDRAVAGGLATN